MGVGLFRRTKKERAKEEEVTVAEVSVETSAENGPFDSESRNSDALIDCGALRIPVLADYQIQFTLERNREIVLGVVYIGNNSALQVQVFAAPKTEDIWDDVRADMMTSIAAQGGSSREAEGEYGKEIRAHMPVEGSNAVNPVRYIGIDGPRWLLRVTLTGRAAVDDEAAVEILHAVLDDLVVVRGSAPYPPREILPMSIPREVRQDKSDEERPSLSLPERGPEISEVR